MSAHDTNTALVYIDTDPNEAPSVPKFKRPLDIVGAVVALSLFSPIMLVVSFAIASKGYGSVKWSKLVMIVASWLWDAARLQPWRMVRDLGGWCQAAGRRQDTQQLWFLRPGRWFNTNQLHD